MSAVQFGGMAITSDTAATATVHQENTCLSPSARWGIFEFTVGALERLNLAVKILSGKHAPTRSEIESLKSSLRVASQMSAEEIASAVIHQELSRNRAPRKDGAYGRR
jgi:hypothetical protein